MQTQDRTLITVVMEAGLEGPVTADLERLGARGWTVVDARGKGTRGERAADWSSIGNVRLEVVCARDLAERIGEHLRTEYFPGNALVMYFSDVRVFRGEKF